MFPRFFSGNWLKNEEILRFNFKFFFNTDEKRLRGAFFTKTHPALQLPGGQQATSFYWGKPQYTLYWGKPQFYWGKPQ